MFPRTQGERAQSLALHSPHALNESPRAIDGACSLPHSRRMMLRPTARALLRCALPALLMSLANAAHAQEDDVAAFYRGKTIRMMAGVAAGAGTDLIARMLARHLTNHIPGHPNIIVQNMPGAGSVQMANNLANTGARDGTMFGAPLNGMPTAPLMTPKTARFDPTKLLWIGSIYRSNNFAYVWHTSPVQTLEQLKTQEVLIGTPGPGSGSYDLSVLSREVLGLKFKLVRGYAGSTEVNIAMERGEIQAQIVGWDSFKAAKPTWIDDKVITILGHYSLEDPPELRPYARIVDLAKTDADRQALRLALARQSYGRPFFLPPDVPPARVEALRRAFDATMKDPAFLTEAQQMKIDVSPMSGEEVQALIAQVHGTTPASVVERVRAIMETPEN
jgi:tripartite-type tricarboxylate transporter receptor subunit TctC